jgi:hypothetical protein
MTQTIEHPCVGMSKAEIDAFDRIAAGGPHRSSTRTLSKLMEAGLVQRHSVAIGPPDRFGPVVRYEYSVSIGAHMQRCEWKIRSRRKSALPQRVVEELPLFALAGGAK